MSHPYATAKGVLNTRVRNSDDISTLLDLRNGYVKPVVLPITVEDYHALSKKERGAAKMPLPYFVGGTVDGKRHDQNITSRTLITLDIEARKDQDPPPPPEDVAETVRALGAEAWIYTSISHTPVRPRYRMVLPLQEPITGDNLREDVMRATTQAAAKRIGLKDWCTSESWVLSQPMYLPARLKNGVYWEQHVNPQGKHFKAILQAPTEVKGLADIPEGKADQVLQALHAAGLYLNEDPGHKGKHFIRCPFADDHGNVNDTQTVYYEAHHDGNPRPAVKCFDTEPDEDGRPHLTYGVLVRWLRDNGHLKSEDETSSEVMDDYDAFMQKASVGQYLTTEPVPREWAWEQFAPVVR